MNNQNIISCFELNSVYLKTIPIICIAVFYSCTQLTSEEKLIKNSLGKTVDISMFQYIQERNKEISFNEFRKKYDFIYLVYLRDGCASCYPKYLEWQDQMSKLELNNNFMVLFIIQGVKFEDFLKSIANSDRKYDDPFNHFCVVMDPKQRFLKKNQAIDQWIINKSVLVDSENRVKLIGSPFASERMRQLFYQICEQ